MSNALLSTLWTRGTHLGLTVCVSIHNACVNKIPTTPEFTAARSRPKKSTDKHLIGYGCRSLEEKEPEGKRKLGSTRQ
jgi:hypothetical protein